MAQDHASKDSLVEKYGLTNEEASGFIRLLKKSKKIKVAICQDCGRLMVQCPMCQKWHEITDVEGTPSTITLIGAEHIQIEISRRDFLMKIIRKGGKI